MMKHKPLLMASFLLAGLIISCNSEKRTEQQSTEAVAGESVGGCFQYIANKDTVQLSFEIIDNIVSGTLSYMFYEKDQSHGVLVGEMKGDTLIADYVFMAEGITSTSEVVFLRGNNQMIQGFGETINEAEKQVFKNRSALDFTDSLVLTEIECKNK